MSREPSAGRPRGPIVGPSTMPVQECKSALLLQIERGLLRLVYQSPR
jgi:hypothetical protein